MHEYFYGAQSSTYSFIRVPTVLFTDDQYKYISAEAKVLYGLLLARMDIVVALDENNENTLKVYGGIDKRSKKVILKYAN